MLHLSNNKNGKRITCGHDQPDSNVDHINKKFENFDEQYQVNILLERPNQVISVTDQSIIGKWTMVYDEGFEFNIKNYVFFGYSKYKKKNESGEPTDNDTTETEGYENICNKTFLGINNN